MIKVWLVHTIIMYENDRRISWKGPGHHKLYVLGMVGRQYFGKKDVDMDGGFRYTVQKPTMHRARIIREEDIRGIS